MTTPDEVIKVLLACDFPSTVRDRLAAIIEQSRYLTLVETVPRELCRICERINVISPHVNVIWIELLPELKETLKLIRDLHDSEYDQYPIWASAEHPTKRMIHTAIESGACAVFDSLECTEYLSDVSSKLARYYARCTYLENLVLHSLGYLKALELELFGQDYASDKPSDRLDRLETAVFGQLSGLTDFTKRANRLKSIRPLSPEKR